MASVIERVRAGATFMDGVAVGWAGKIDGDRLDLSGCNECVLGQSFDDHYTSVKANLGLSEPECAALGFRSEESLKSNFRDFMLLSAEAKEARRNRVSAEYASLRTAWLAEIDARLCPTPVAPREGVEA